MSANVENTTVATTLENVFSYQYQRQAVEMRKKKMAVWGGLTDSFEKKRSKKQMRKGKI